MPYPYELLEIPETADQKEIRRAYLEQIRRYPPERSPARFQEVVKAYQLIRDETERTRLEIFGMPGSKSRTRLSDLVLPPSDRRNRIGIEAWLGFLR
jgi:curved DNA-binding protein CbpA